MKVSFLSPDQNELVALQKDYTEDLSEVKEAIFDFFLYKEGTHTDNTFPDKYKDWRVFMGKYTNMFATIISSHCYGQQTIGSVLKRLD